MSDIGQYHELEEYLQTMKGLKEIDALVKGGKSFNQMALHFGIPKDTLYYIARKHPVVYQAIADAEEAMLDMIEISLVERCHTHKIKERVIELDPVTRQPTKITQKEKEIPASDKAMEFMLTNRRGNMWKNRQEVGFDKSNGSGLPIVIVDNLAMKGEVEEVTAPTEPIFKRDENGKVIGFVDGFEEKYGIKKEGTETSDDGEDKE